jgi:predicted amidohydrolase YtcJ
VLDKDPQEVSRKTIKDIKVIATITGGRPMLTAQTRNPNW